MAWTIESSQPVSLPAVYFLILPTDNKVLYTNNIGDSPMEFIGDAISWKWNNPEGTPLIPMDIHHALLLNWVQTYDLARNMPYLDDKIRAAVALVV